jgi:hypothetical protein
LVRLAAQWSDFHLASDEYKARAVVQKARDLEGLLHEAETRAREEQRHLAAEAARKDRHDRDERLRKGSELLLAQFDMATTDGDPQRRGYLLQDLLNRLFDLHGIPVVRSFQRNGGAEQIDGAFTMDGWHYIVECRWRAKLADIRELDGLYGQVERSGRQTMGLFLSVNGWSEHVLPTIKQNPSKSIVLMEGFDLRSVLAQRCGLKELLKAKVVALNLEAEPFLSVTTHLSRS